MVVNQRATDNPAINFVRTSFSPATRVATPQQRKFALSICLALTIATVILIPFAQLQWVKVPAFLPAYQTAVIGIYLVTAYLMFGQFNATRSEALLHLGASCLYTSGVLALQFLSFTGAFVDNSALIGGPQTTSWLWLFWHAGPAIGILFYSRSERHHPGKIVGNPRRAILQTLITLFVALAATALLVTTFHDWLPILDVNGNYRRIISTGVAPALQVLLIISLALLWQANNFRNVLHLWLGITLVALLCDNTITMIGATRLSVGWYAGRISALISSSVMLVVYLQDIKRSYEGSMQIAHQLTHSNAQLEDRIDEARLDSLTKLPRRDFFIEQAEQLRALSIESDIGFATLFIDLDGFKAVNDKHGHAYGDIILVRSAEALKSALRTTDVAGRLGGDEFVACLSVPADSILIVANEISARIVKKISELGDGIGASVGISIGSADVPSAIREADAAMYEAKRQGKNRVTLFRRKLEIVNAA